MSSEGLPDSSVVKARRPWMAALANLFAPPLGHIYIGKPFRGVVAVALNLIVGLAIVFLSLRATGRFPFVLLMCLLLFAYAAVAADAYIIARRAGSSFQLKPYNRWYGYLGLLIVFSLGGEATRSLIRSEIAQAYKVPSEAMVPTLLAGDHILTDKTIYRSRSPERFDVVVFEYPEDPQKTFVKRVVGLPGETIEVRNKKVWINSSQLQEPYVRFAASVGGLRVSPGDSFGPFRIPERSYFLLGDNRDKSYDSRFWGPVVREKIWGRVCVIYFSWGSDRFSVRWDRIGATVK